MKLQVLYIVLKNYKILYHLIYIVDRNFRNIIKLKHTVVFPLNSKIDIFEDAEIYIFEDAEDSLQKNLF